MDIISAYREVGTYRGAAAISGTTPKTVKRVIARHEAGGGRRRRGSRGGTTTTRSPTWWPSGWRRRRAGSSAKRLLPAARAAGYDGSARNFRRLVATQKALWRQGQSSWSAAGGVVTG